MPVIALLIELYCLVVLVSVVGSWVRSRHRVFQYADRLTDPVLAPLRRIVPPLGGLDLTPMLLIIALQFLARLFR